MGDFEVGVLSYLAEFMNEYSFTSISISQFMRK